MRDHKAFAKTMLLTALLSFLLSLFWQLALAKP